MSGPMNLVYPTPGDTTNTWGTILNALLTLVENHDHTSGKGLQVPSAGIGINADLGFASFAATAVKALAFTAQATSSVASYASTLFVSSADSNLYFRNSGGTNVQITDGTTINISLVGGIGGDYSSVGALLSYDDSSKNYWLQQEGSPRPWAGLQTAGIALFQKAASISNAVTIKSPSSLAASYALTMPAALPASITGLTVNASGQIAETGALSLPVNSAGGVTPAGGLYLGRQQFTASGTYTPSAGCKNVHIRMIGGGGGGGGGISASNSAAGGGGASGQYLDIWGTVVSAGGTVTIGAAGTAGANTGGNGGNGGNTSIGVTLSGTPLLIVANGGNGGTGAGNSALSSAAGGTANFSSNTGDFTFAESGEAGRSSTTTSMSGAGGSTPFGAGGRGVPVYTVSAFSTAGNAGGGYGAGGSGGMSANSGAGALGGVGTAGMIIVDEWA